MKQYMFEIQNCIKVFIDANSAEEARSQLLDDICDHAEEMIDTCTVSDGQEVKR